MEQTFKEGDKVFWNDPAIDDFDEDEREEQASRVYTIIFMDEEDETATIADGYSEAEVYLSELVHA